MEYLHDGTLQISRLYPFGEEAQSTSAEYKWTDDIRDGNALDHFAARSYSSNLARWLSPDPAGLAAVNPADPQTWNEYAYVENRPLSATDPLGLMCPGGDCSRMVLGLAELAGAGCTANGIDAGCGSVSASLASGAGVECPNDNCDLGGPTPYRCIDEVCNYMTLHDAATYPNEWNGVLYTNAEFAQLEAKAVDAQRWALADAIGQATGQSASDVYGQLNYLYTKSGNANFEFTGDPSEISGLFPGCNGGGEDSGCRYPDDPSIHWAAGGSGAPTLHLDAGDPFWNFPIGFLNHLGDLLGMINSSVPFGTGQP